MRKGLPAVIILFLFTLKSFPQQFQHSVVLYSSPQCCGAIMSGTADEFSFDRFGRAYYHVYEHACTFCTDDGYFNKFDYNGAGGGSYHEFYGSGPLYPGNNVNGYYVISAGYLKKILTFSPVWSIQLSGNNYRYVSDDYSGNVFYLSSDSLTKYDSSGVLIWKKSGGGNIVKPDAAGNYYVAAPSLTKYDATGNFIRSLPYGASKFVLDDSCNVYMLSNGITKIDSAGNLIFQYPVSASQLAVDVHHNVYYISGNTVGKLDSTGTVIKWTKSFVTSSPGAVGVDSMLNCYVMSTLASGFLPPDGYCNYNTASSNSFYLAITKLAPPLYSDTVRTGNVAYNHRLCAGDSINVYFYFFLQQLSPPFKVELSDSTGSFSNPVVLGTGTGNNIKVLIPFSIPAANGYRIRVKTLTGSPILIPNADGPFRINNKPPSAFTVSGYTKYENGVYYGCAAGIPIQLNAATVTNCKYQWYKYNSPYPGYNGISGATNTLYNTPASIGINYYLLFTTDTTIGCSGISGIDTVRYTDGAVHYISNLPAAVCLDHAPVSLNIQPAGGTLSGNGVYWNMFYPDSAGTGIQHITCTYDTWGCGIVDTVQSITVNSLPSAAITAGGPATFCSGGSVVLNVPVNNNRTYQWKKGGNDLAGAIASNYTASIGGVYKVTVTNTITGCSKTSVPGTVVTVKPHPNSTITPQGPTTFCAGGSVVLNANTGTGLSYQWKKGGTDIPAATSDNYTATIGGVYKVREVNSYGCAKLSTGVVVSVPCRKEEELNEINGSISIFPNPATGKFTIQSITGKISQITITNVSGQVIYKKQFLDSPLGAWGSEIDLTNQSKGIYLIQVITGVKVYNQKIILN